MSSYENQLTALFEHFAQDLAQIDPQSKDAVRCPLCAQLFGREALADRGPDGLSIEHIIPSALGGKIVTLTCRRCNNETASAVEAHFIRRVRADDWTTGDGSVLKGTIKIGEDVLPLKVSLTDGTKPTVLKVPGGKPEVLERYRNFFAGAKEGWEFNFQVKLDYKLLNARQGALRIAFLALAHDLGYRYSLSAAGEEIRRIIRHGTSDELKPFIMGIGSVGGNTDQPPLRTIAIQSAENEVPAYLLLIRMNIAQMRYYSVLMPGPTLVNDQEFLAKLLAVAKSLHGKRFSV